MDKPQIGVIGMAVMGKNLASLAKFLSTLINSEISCGVKTAVDQVSDERLAIFRGIPACCIKCSLPK